MTSFLRVGRLYHARDCSRKTMMGLALLGLGLFEVGTADGQVPSYRAGQLVCARFRQLIQSDIRIETRGRVIRESSGRDAVLVVRSSALEDGVGLESWFDALEVWRESSGGRNSPDTDGLIGGRYRGRLGTQGGYQSEIVPFIPDEVAEVADLRSAPADLFPTLPSKSLGVGGSWAGSSGWKLRRLADSTAGGTRLQRYQASGHWERKEARPMSDTLKVEVRESEDESGTFVWDSARGPLRWDRRITTETAVPAGGVVRSAVRTRIEQRALVERLAAPGPDPTACL